MKPDGKPKGRQRWRCHNPDCEVKTRVEGTIAKVPKTAAERFKDWYDRATPEQRAARKKGYASHIISCSVPEDLWAAVNQRAGKDQVSRSELLRRAIEQYLK
jgi:hypothetical protein